MFSGSAREACRGFPANVNVMAAVSLAGIGPDQTRARIILAVPGLARNCHDIDVEGEFGRLQVHIENIPSENPKTGKLTALVDHSRRPGRGGHGANRKLRTMMEDGGSKTRSSFLYFLPLT